MAKLCARLHRSGALERTAKNSIKDTKGGSWGQSISHSCTPDNPCRVELFFPGVRGVVASNAVHRVASSDRSVRTLFATTTPPTNIRSCQLVEAQHALSCAFHTDQCIVAELGRTLFRDLSEQRLRRGVFHSLPELTHAVERPLETRKWQALHAESAEQVNRVLRRLQGSSQMRLSKRPAHRSYSRIILGSAIEERPTMV